MSFSVFRAPANFECQAPLASNGLFQDIKFPEYVDAHKGKIRKTQKAALKRLFFQNLYGNKINMDPGDDFEVLRPFSRFSGEI